MRPKGRNRRPRPTGCVRRSVRSVAYREIAYEGGEPAWRAESDSFDSLDFGLELHLDDGRVVSFTWGMEFVQYNMSVLDGELQLGDSARWDVSTRWNTLGLIDRLIVGVTTSWEASDLSAVEEYPQDVRLTFETGRVVVISVFEQRGADFAAAMTDHITVFFDAAEERRSL